MTKTRQASLDVLNDITSRRRLPLISEVLVVFAAHFSIWIHNYRSRQDLANMSQENLRDIGLSPEDVDRETAKRFWHL